MKQFQVVLTPPTWVNGKEIVREWAGISCVKVISIELNGKQVIVMVEGTTGDLAIFRRIVKLNTAGW